MSSSGGPSVHVIGRESVEHASFPAGAVSGLTRAIMGSNGYTVEKT